MVRSRLLVAVLAPACAVSLAVSACGGSGVGPCRSAQLKLRLGQTGAAMGSVGASATFTNISSSPCTLDGYPGLQMLSTTGARLPTVVDHSTSVTTVPRLRARVVSLKPGGRATFYLGFEDATGYGSDTCPTSARVAVTPPGDRAPITVSWQLQPYGGTTEHLQCGRISLSPVVSGASSQP